MSVAVDNRLRTYGARPSGDYSLPTAGGDTQASSTFTEWVGKAVNVAGKLLIPAGVAGALAGGILTRRGAWPLTVAGAAGGAALAGGATLVGAHLFGDAEPDPSVNTRAPLPRQHPIAPGEQLRVMTWNIHGGHGPGDGPVTEKNLEQVARQIEAQDPDIVVLEEVDNDHPLPGRLDQTEWLSNRLGATTSAAYAPANQRLDGQQHGNSILTFHGVRLDGARSLGLGDLETGPGFHPRNYLDSFVTTPDGNTLRVLGTHLSGVGESAGGNRTDSQDIQLGSVLPQLDAWHGPTILGGDFNVRSQSEWGAQERAMLESVGLDDTFLGAGISPDSPERGSLGENTDVRIDRIYASSDAFTVDDAFVARSDNPASDHHPVVADLRVTGS